MIRKPLARRAFSGLVGLPPEAETTVSKPTAITGTTIDEQTLRQELGVSEPKSERKLPRSYRQTLNLDPQDIIDFFDVKVGESDECAQKDFVVPPSMLEHRIRRLQNIIKRAKEIVEGLSVRAMKIRRGKDEVLDKATREKYKREENARIARCNAKLFRYRNALRSGAYHEQIWTAKPILFSDTIDDLMIFKTLTEEAHWEDTEAVLTGGLHTHNRTELIEGYHLDGCMNLDAYRDITKLGVDALFRLGETDSQMRQAWKNVVRWENNIIRAAVHDGIICPRRDLAELLGLSGVLDKDDDLVEADRTEDALAIKTGGACYGGRIKSEGFRYRGGKISQRSLSSFDKPIRPARSSVYADSGFGSLRDIHDDVESYDPR